MPFRRDLSGIVVMLHKSIGEIKQANNTHAAHLSIVNPAVTPYARLALLDTAADSTQLTRDFLLRVQVLKVAVPKSEGQFVLSTVRRA